MRDLIKLYIDTNCNSENTKMSYSSDLICFIEFVNKELNDITPLDIVAFKNSLSSLSSATINRRLGTVKRFFSFLYANDYIQKDIAKAIRCPKVVNKEEETLTKNDIDKLISSGKNPRDKAIVAVLASTGLRISELCDIKVDDIDSNNNIKILGKGQKWRLIHLNKKTKEYVKQYLKVRKNGCDRLFVSNRGNAMTQHTINNTLKTLGKRSGVGSVHPHMLRHYLATALLDNGVPIEQIQLVLGHSNIATTLRYAAIRNKKDVVENVLELELI